MGKNFRRVLFAVLLSNPFWFALDHWQRWEPYIENFFRQPRDRLLRSLESIFALSLLLLGLLRWRALWAWAQRRRSRNVTIVPGTGSLTLTGSPPVITISSPPELPPGTRSNSAMAFQPQYVNNSQWAQWYAHEQQQNVTAMLAMQSAQSSKLAYLPNFHSNSQWDAVARRDELTK